MKTGTLIATAVATLVFAGIGTAEAHGKKTKAEKKSASAVHCAAVNACKGQGSCASATNSCKGQNACKGQGWIASASATDCTTRGGTVVAVVDDKAMNKASAMPATTR